MPWYVLYTKPKNEKKVALLLCDKGIEVYCPLQETIKQWSDRKKKVQEPLFKSYIFVFLEDYKSEQVNVLSIKGADRFLWWKGKPGVAKEEEIEGIKQFLNEYKGAEMAASFNIGEEIMIKEGALKEHSGKITHVKGNKAYLQIKSLGWNITAELPVQMLEKIYHSSENKKF